MHSQFVETQGVSFVHSCENFVTFLEINNTTDGYIIPFRSADLLLRWQRAIEKTCVPATKKRKSKHFRYFDRKQFCANSHRDKQA